MAEEPVTSPRRRQEVTILTSYSESMFLLASQMSIGMKPVELLPAPVGRGYVLQCEWPYFQLPFEEVLTPVAELLLSCGASRVGKFWSEPSPVFDVDFDSQTSIEQMVDSLESGQVREGVESIILSLAQMAWSQTNPDTIPEWKLDISLELLQVLPNADTKDAIIHQVSSTNSSMCAHLWNERKVFDVGALLRWYRSKPLGGFMGASGEIKLMNLVRELKEVVGWTRLGLQLGVPKHTLENIRHQFTMYGEEMCKTEMLATWLNSRAEEPTWAEVVSAVSRTGNKRAASRIADKYGLALAVLKEANTAAEVSLVTNDPLETLGRELKDTYTAIDENETKMQICSAKKRKLEGDIAETQYNYDIVQRYTDILTKDKESLEQKVEEKEREIRSLQSKQLEYERKICDLEVKLATASAKAKQKLKDRLKHMKQEKGELVECIEAKQSEICKLKKKMSKLTLKLERTKSDLSSTQSQLELKTCQLDEVQQQFKLIKDQRNELKKQLEVQEKAMEEVAMQHADSDKLAIKAPMQLQLQNWTHCRHMPFGVSGAQAVILDRKVYIGGGDIDDEEGRSVILVYNPDRNDWSDLPRCPVVWYAMASLNHELVLAGGLEGTSRTNKLTLWNSTSHKWTHPYPPMPTARYGASAIGYQHFLVVAGGSGNIFNSFPQTTVEVLDTSSSQWYTAHPLPVACTYMTSALLGDTLYLMGATSGKFIPDRNVFTTSLPDLISDATSHAPTMFPMNPTTVTTWESLRNSPQKYSTALAFQNVLVAIGGQDDEDEHASSIQFYNPVSKVWVKFGNMPVRTLCPTCAMLPSRELLVCGGWDECGKHSNKVYKVCVLAI